MQNFTIEPSGDIARVTFDSGRMNTLTPEVIEELQAAVAEVGRLHEAGDVAAAVLSGNRYGLGAGADIKLLNDGAPEEVASFIDRGHDAFLAIEDAGLPWIAHVDGYALGGIYELALSCHAIVVSEKAGIGLPEVTLGVFPGLGGTQRLPRRTGFGWDDASDDGALRAMLTGKRYTAEEALALGFVDTIGAAPTTAADATAIVAARPQRDGAFAADAARRLGSRLIDESQPVGPGRHAPETALDVAVGGFALGLREGLRLERDAFLAVVAGEEAKRGMNEFFARQAERKKS